MFCGAKVRFVHVGGKGLCPSERSVDEKSVGKRVKVELLDSDDDGGLVVEDNWSK